MTSRGKASPENDSRARRPARRAPGIGSLVGREREWAAVFLPLWSVPLPWPCSNSEYERLMSGVLQRAVAARITHVAFGDLFLEDIREYRVGQLAPTGIEPLFPLWCSPRETPALARAMLDGGLKAVVTCVDPNKLPATFAGRAYDATMLADLPPGVEVCASVCSAVRAAGTGRHT